MQRIEYRHHPRFGADVRVVRTLKHFQEEVVTVQFDDGSRLGVPRWMLDPATCNRLTQATSPRIAVQALLRLLTVWEVHHLHRQDKGPSSRVSSPSTSTEGDYAQSQNRPMPSTSTGPSREGAMGQVAHGPETALLRVVAADPAKLGAQSAEGKDAR